RQAIERQVDAVVGYATLWKVVRADALGAVAGADLELARLRLRGLLPFPFGREQARFQKRHRPRAVLVLRALVLAFDHDAARQVRDAHGRVRLVHVLSACAGGAEGVDAQVGVVDLDVLDLVQLRKDRHGDRRGMDAALRLRCRHALHAVRARFELEARVGAPAADARDHFLVSAVLAGALAQYLDGETFRFGIAGVHAQQ